MLNLLIGSGDGKQVFQRLFPASQRLGWQGIHKIAANILETRRDSSFDARNGLGSSMVSTDGGELLVAERLNANRKTIDANFTPGRSLFSGD